MSIPRWKWATSRGRFWFGKAADRPELDAAVELEIRESGEIAGRATIGSYAGTVSVKSGTTEDVIPSAAEQVVRFVTE